MNAFQEDAHFEDERKTRGILSAWALFRLEIPRLVNDYNQTAQGQAHSAEIQETVHSIVITCPQGPHPENLLKILVIK